MLFGDTDGCIFRLKALVAMEKQAQAVTAGTQTMEQIKTFLEKFHTAPSSAPADASS